MYDGLDPQNYIMVKGVLDIIRKEQVALSMALENGVIIMVRPIDAAANIYINSNHFDEEIIMTSKGKLEEGLGSYVDEFGKVIR